MAETLKCPNCGSEVDSVEKNCSKCNVYIRSELEILRDIDAAMKSLTVLKDINASLKVIKGIAIWWLILSILSVIAALLYILSRL
jgi:hypothetical protein